MPHFSYISAQTPANSLCEMIFDVSYGAKVRCRARVDTTSTPFIHLVLGALLEKNRQPLSRQDDEILESTQIYLVGPTAN